MQNKKLIRFAESFLFLPIMTIAPMGSAIAQVAANIVLSPQAVLSQKLNNAYDSLAINQAIDLEVVALKAQAEAIDAYFSARNMPLSGMGAKMAEEAQKNGLDWRLLPAIAMRESTGGKNACDRVKYNSFGWGSCRIGFSSDFEAIEIVAKNLGGNNSNTARHYENKTTRQILRAYNPPYVVPRYAEQVMSIMQNIGDAEVITVAQVAT